VIDRNLLPRRIIFDTGVFFRGLGERPQEPDSTVCAALFEAAIKNGAMIYVAAPTLTEHLRWKDHKKIPHEASIRFVAFDEEAARLLGEIDNAVVQSVKDTFGLPINYLRYDAMIAACAKRLVASAVRESQKKGRTAPTIHFVTLDGGAHMRAFLQGLDMADMVRHPREYLLPIMTLIDAPAKEGTEILVAGSAPSDPGGGPPPTESNTAPAPKEAHTEVTPPVAGETKSAEAPAVKSMVEPTAGTSEPVPQAAKQAATTNEEPVVAAKEGESRSTPPQDRETAYRAAAKLFVNENKDFPQESPEGQAPVQPATPQAGASDRVSAGYDGGGRPPPSDEHAAAPGQEEVATVAGS
jgi:predicted nucleic acid-binding protein